MASAATESPRPSGNLRRYVGYTAVLVVLLAGWRVVDDAARSHLFLINRSPSLPNWAYVVERGGEPSRGAVSFFMPRRNKLVVSHFGEVPAAFGKIAYGVPGDRIERIDGRVFVVPAGAGQRVQVGVLKPLSSRGEPLEAGPTGVIPEGCYYMGSPHKDGFDSRYAAIGFVCRGQIVGTATKVIL